MSKLTRRQRSELAKKLGLPEQATADQVLAKVDEAASSAEMRVVSTHHSGPLPSPETLAEYGKVFAELPERIVRMAEREQEKRHDLESMIIQAQIQDAVLQREETARGQKIGGIVVCLCVACGTVMVGLGATAAGLTAIFAPLAAIGGAFIWRRVREREPVDSKNKLPPAKTPKAADDAV